MRKLFGTDGVRGKAGEFPLDEYTVELIGHSLALNLAQALGKSPKLIIGRDTRESGPVIAAWLARGTARAGAKVESAGVITTPGVAFIARSTPFDAGVVISASHNPYQDNGIKIFSPSGKKIADELERRIEEDVATLQKTQEIGNKPKASVISSVTHCEVNPHYRNRYIDYLVKEVGRGLKLDGLKIAIDCANGAACYVAPQVFEQLGARLNLLSAQPDGRNINAGCGSLYPEKLRQAVLESRFDLGIAFDGDADRAVFVDSTGSLVDGDNTMLILADYLKSRGRLSGQTVVATVMSNIGLEIALRQRGIQLVRTRVGDRYVLEELLTRNASLGGEQSGHIILPEISLAGDGIITAIELLRAVEESGRPLAELAGQLTRFPQVLVNVQVRHKPPLESLPQVKSEMERIERDLQGRGRLLVRYSGTENLARVMIEGEDQTKIEEQANSLAELIKKAIG
jgi:phosphoglucosamine mutase